MFEHILLFLLLPAFVFSATDLETTCTGTDRVYSDGSCLVLNKTAVRYSKAKVSCEHYLGYSGHLVFIRNDIVENTLQQLITSNSVSNVYVGYEQTNTTGLRNGSWVYAYTNGSTATASYLPWKTGSPSKNNTYDRTYYTASGVIDTAGEITSSAFVCQYEENLKQTVSDLEEKCAANSRVHVYSNGHCYIARSDYKYYYAAKYSCQDIPGIYGHLVHIRNAEQAQMVETMIKASSISYAWTGLEATNTSSTNKSLPDSWSYATPQDTKEIATFLPWIPGNPYNSISASATFYYQIVHGLRNINLNSYTFGFICEYEDTKPMATDLEFKCASLAPSLYRAYRNDSCYVMSNSLYYYNKASLSCKDILGYDGHLIHPRSTDDLIMMSSLSGALNGGYLNIWVGIEQTNLTGSITNLPLSFLGKLINRLAETAQMFCIIRGVRYWTMCLTDIPNFDSFANTVS
uniref:C-type lectin domain-containing protein n=1 Tax=Plectus sambesii TaxID=2011161 RepID=A0A914WUA8_9BILA